MTATAIEETDTQAAMPCEWDQAAIGRWADEAMGRGYTAIEIVAHANRRMAELLDWMTRDPNALALQPVKLASVDVLIMLYRLANFSGFDLQGELDRRMQARVGGGDGH